MFLNACFKVKTASSEVLHKFLDIDKIYKYRKLFKKT